LSDAATRVARGDLGARSGVLRADELGDAALEFDRMVVRLEAVEKERTLMLSSISHDLRTPLAALRASVEAIRDGVAPDPDAALKGMEHQVQALAALVDDLGLHTRLASGTLAMRPTRIDLTELADEAVETLRPLATASDVRLAIVAGDRIALTADQAQLGRVVRNLVENAIRHSPSAGTVTVELEVDRASDDASAVVRVVDEGEGFPPELGERAFEPFTRGDPARDVRTGTAGLGLAIAAAIVEAHGGGISIVSSDNGGGVIEVRLPM
jgi:signal transduction histidine kinase